jgi:peptidoglycan/xylan/chitin deacetylase (PgdA/CDA1 family)
VTTVAADRVLAILAYHKVGLPPAGGWESWFYTPEAAFAAQLAYLRDADWRVLDVPAFLRGLADPAALPRRAALVTFDDGYRSNLEVAVPWLERFGYPAVMFVPTDYVGGRNAFDHGAEPDEAICSWDELRELERRGVSVQSHGCSHRGFSELTPAERDRELRRSKAVLEDGLNQAVELFAFPFGDGCGPDPGPPELRASLEGAGYRAAFLYPGGPARPPLADPYRLPRVAIGSDTELRDEIGPRA